jgi:AbrB family looped-hinge helix DNA binding protein
LIHERTLPGLAEGINGLPDGDLRGRINGMGITVRLDGAGRLVLPKALRERLHLRAGAKLTADVVADKIELTPEPDTSVRLVRKGKVMVITGVKEPFDAVAAVKDVRAEREEQLARRGRQRE